MIQLLDDGKESEVLELAALDDASSVAELGGDVSSDQAFLRRPGALEVDVVLELAEGEVHHTFQWNFRPASLWHRCFSSGTERRRYENSRSEVRS